MSITAKLVALAALMLAIVAGVWKLWHTADQAGYERAQRECQAAAERQREENRAAAQSSEKKESVRVVYRDRVVTKIVKETQDATVSLAACPLPAAAVSLLNETAQCAREGGPSACAADTAVPAAR